MLRNPLYVYGDAEVNVPSGLNLGRLMLDSFKKYGENIALVNGSSHEKLTYQEMLRNSINVALSLSDMGVRKGDIIAICSENRQEYFSTLVGIICTGATVTTLNELDTQEEFIHMLNTSKPKMMFCSPLAYKIHMKTLITEKLDLIMFGNKKTPNAKLYENIITDHGISERDFEVIEVGGQSDTAVILYSSATTGLPKGIMLTHLNIATWCKLPRFNLDLNLSSSSLFSDTKWSNNLGLFTGLRTFLQGRPLFYLPEFQSNLYLETLEKYRVTEILAAPAVLEALCKINQNDYDVSSVRVVYSGVSLLRDDTVQRVQNRFPNLKYIYQSYGMTETTLSITLCSFNMTNPCCVTSVGRIIGSTIVKIIDIKTKKILGPHQPGEICVKGPTVMKGYIDKDRSDDFDSEEFFRTGDVGYYDDNKYFFILNRLQDLIKYKDCEVSPIDIEETLFKHPSIRDVAVIGVPYDGAEAPCAFVVVRSRNKPTEDDVKQFVAERSPVSKHLRGGVLFIDEIPRNVGGKVLRKRLREMFEEMKGV